MLPNNETEKIIPKAGYLYTYRVAGGVEYCMFLPRTETNLNKFYHDWKEKSPENLYMFRELYDGDFLRYNRIYHRDLDQVHGIGLKDDDTESDHQVHETELLTILYGWEE